MEAQRQEMESQRQENRDLMETVNRLVSQIGDNRDLPPPAVLTSSSSSELMSQQNQALKWLDKVFKLEATTTQQKAIEWIQLVEANLRRSPLPEARWVPMAGYRADSYFSRTFTEWEREDPGLDWTGFRNQFMNKVAGAHVSVAAANKRLNSCRQAEGEKIMAFVSRFQQEMLNHRQSLMHLPERLHIPDFHYYQKLKEHLQPRFADYLAEKESSQTDVNVLTPMWARDKLAHMAEMKTWEPQHDLSSSSLMMARTNRYPPRGRGGSKKRQFGPQNENCWHCGQAYTGWAHKKECPKWPKKPKASGGYPNDRRTPRK
jgi:hypothetical protein